MRDHYYSGVAAEKEDGDLYFEEKDQQLLVRILPFITTCRANFDLFQKNQSSEEKATSCESNLYSNMMSVLSLRK